MVAPKSGRSGEGGQNAHLESVGTDGTDQDIRQQNTALIAEVARLTEAVEARDAFLAATAHDLRNPMTPIACRIQILGRAMRRPNVQVEQLAQNIDQIEWLITRYLKRATVLLDVSRITSGKLRLDRLPVDVCEVAHEVIEYFLPVAQQTGSGLTLDLPDEAVVVSGDRLAIEEILDNLVSNAIKYGANKAISLRIAAALIHPHFKRGGLGRPYLAAAAVYIVSNECHQTGSVTNESGIPRPTIRVTRGGSSS